MSMHTKKNEDRQHNTRGNAVTRVIAVTPGMTVHRPVKGKLRVKMPYRPGNRRHLLNAGCRGSEWTGTHWLVSRSRLHDLVHYLTWNFGDVEVIIDGYSTQKCDTRCVEAKGDDCVCSCAGANHKGGGNWVQVGETTLISHERTRSHFIAPELRKKETA